MYGYRIGYNVFNGARVRMGQLLNYLRWFSSYLKRVTDDGGTVQDDTFTKKVLKSLQENKTYDDTLLLFTAEGGLKTRVDGNNTFVTKGYDAGGDDINHDLTQTTENRQLYLSGNIAPNEVQKIKNTSSSNKSMEHPSISFLSTDSWSVTFCCNINGESSVDNIYPIRDNTVGASLIVYLRSLGNYKLRIAVNGSNTEFQDNGTLPILGKNAIITIVYINGIINAYINGIEQTRTVTGGANPSTFSSLLYQDFFDGTIPYHRIQQGAMTPEQVAKEASDLRALIPEVETVQIGTQTWATSNCEMIATPMGTIIPEVQDNATWANSQTLYDNAYAATVGTEDEKVRAGVEAAAMWCYYNNDPALGAIYGKLYNWFAVKLLQLDIDAYNLANPTTPWGYHVPTQTEFNTLATALGGTSVAGGKMKAKFDIFDNMNADNTSGFTAIPSGARSGYSGNFLSGRADYFTVSDANSRKVQPENTELTLQGNNEVFGASVRLIKD